MRAIRKILLYLAKGAIAVIAIASFTILPGFFMDDDFTLKQVLTIYSYMIPSLTPVAALVFAFCDFRLDRIEEKRKENNML